MNAADKKHPSLLPDDTVALKNIIAKKINNWRKTNPSCYKKTIVLAIKKNR